MTNKPFFPIHTSDRILFKRCRRKWDLRSSIRRHLEPIDQTPNINLWFGTGFHFALEDYHGYNRFGDPVKALEAYFMAFSIDQLPEGAEETIAMGMDMFEYYKKWSENRERYETVWLDGKPMVEVKFELELADLSEIAEVPVIYRGTLDRVAKDPYGDWWIEDYKTAANIDINKLATDPQVTSYCWAGEQYFEREIAGMLYTQFAKKSPQPPKILQNGFPSLNKQQKTTHRLYRDGLLQIFPDGDFPSDYTEFLNYLAEKETPEGDAYIRRDPVYRNLHAKENAYKHIWQEVFEMITPDLFIYPNPTRDCIWDCAEFRPICLAMDEGDDWGRIIEDFYREQREEDETWKQRIKWPVAP